MDNVSPRVTSEMMPKYIGRTVRLTCKVIKLQGDRAIVQAPDNGQITIMLINDSNISDLYIDVIGKVKDATTLQMFRASNWGAELDMEIIRKTIEEIHRLTDWFA